MSQGNKFGSTATKSAPVSLTPGLGGIYITDTNPANGSFSRIFVLAAAVAHIEGSDIDGDMSAVVLPVGATIEINFQRITLASGKIIAYYGGKKWVDPS